MNDVVFREYDIRGTVDQELSIDQVYDLTRTIAFYFKQHNPRLKTIVVGMDGRTHSPAIKEEICRGLIDSGIEVLFLGVCPSPVLYFALHTQPVDGGLMITASHNSAEYNGIKICLGNKSVWGKEIQIIRALYQQKKSLHTLQPGTMRTVPIIPSYLDWLSDQFSHLKDRNLNIVIDCGNGTAGTVLPPLLKQLNWKNVSLLYPEVDGRFPNHEADPTVAHNMREVKRVLETTDAAFGIGLDGDCDRMAVMAKSGSLIPGDQLLSVFAQDVLKEHPGAGVVFDIKSSAGLTELLEQWKAQSIMSPSGHSIIKDMMYKHRALLGGELSCHFFFKDRAFGYDDGIYAMLRFCEIVHQSGKSPQELLAAFPPKYSSPEFRIPCPDEKKNLMVATLKEYFLAKKSGRIITIDGIRVNFPFGWGIVRASNTQAALSMRFESESKKGLHRVMDQFETALKKGLSQAELLPLQLYKETS